DRANPFHAICRTAGSYTQQQTEYCTTRTDMPVCAPNLLTTCAGNPFEAICLAVDFYTTDRETVIADCALETPTAPAKCDLVIEGGTTVATCITDPFNVANGCNGNTGFEETRTARTTLCTEDATLFNGLCDNFGVAGAIVTTRDGICNTDATSFHADCLVRTGGEAEDARKAFVIACRLDSETEGCNTSITKDSPVTVGVCAANPYRDICKDDVNFADELSFRNGLCTDTTTFFDDLCGVYDGIDMTRETHCTTGATSFDTICDGQGYDTDRDAGQEAFAEMCRGDSSIQICKDTKINPSGSISVADCVNSVDGVDLAGDPWHPNCPPTLSFVVKERIERDRDCAVIQVLESNRCNFAKNFNLCVKDPFGTDGQGEACDATVYETAQTNRNAYCRGSGIADDPLCVGRKAYICDGRQMDGDPFATLCGNDNHDNQIAFCTLNTRTDGVCSNDRATVCPGNPFNDAFGANELDCTISDYYSDRIPTCLGTINDLTAAGVELADCAVLDVADVICGTASEIGSDPFAPICAETDATTNIVGFDQDTEQQRFCGDTIKTGDRASECVETYKDICVGDFLFMDRVGAGFFDCSSYGEIANIRVGICTTKATSFNRSCEDGVHGAEGEV
nr:hypothetical protein [Pseudomonadota bacterium]